MCRGIMEIWKSGVDHGTFNARNACCKGLITNTWHIIYMIYFLNQILPCFLLTTQADVLVNSASSNLKHPTTCGRALIRVGGAQYIEACRAITSVKSGEIVCTSGGKLSCRNINMAYLQRPRTYPATRQRRKR